MSTYSQQTVPTQGRKNLIGLALVAVAAAVVVAVLVMVSHGEGAKTAVPAAGKAPAGQGDVSRLFRGIPQHGTVLGDPKAPLTMVEFADLQCPFCGQYGRDVLPVIVARYVRTGRLRLDLRLLRFLGPDSRRAAQVAAAAARQNRLWQFTHLFFSNQGDENSGYVTEQFVRTLARATPGLDVARAMSESLNVENALVRGEAEAARLRIESTPSFLVGRSNGPLERLTPSDLQPDTFTARFDQLLRP